MKINWLKINRQYLFVKLTQTLVFCNITEFAEFLLFLKQGYRCSDCNFSFSGCKCNKCEYCKQNHCICKFFTNPRKFELIMYNMYNFLIEFIYYNLSYSSLDKIIFELKDKNKHFNTTLTMKKYLEINIPKLEKILNHAHKH